MRGYAVQFVGFLTVNPIYQHSSIHLLPMKKVAAFALEGKKEGISEGISELLFRFY